MQVKVRFPLVLSLLLLGSIPARAEEMKFSTLDAMLLDTGRVPAGAPVADAIRVEVHGEYQLRYQHMRAPLLTPTLQRIQEVPGLVFDSTGQTRFVSHWLRLTPRVQVKKGLEFVGQFDLTGLVLGDLARDTRMDATPRDEYDAFKNLQPRWLYLESMSKLGLLRIGQQPTHWGMGIVANDGNHPTLFGDHRYGSIVEQILFATKPGGLSSPFVLAFAGNLVFKDNIARIERGDRAWQGIVAAYYERGTQFAGLYAVYRNQQRDRAAGASFYPYTDELEAGVFDAAFRTASPLGGSHPTSFVFGAAEGALILGSSNQLRTVDQTLSGTRTTLRSHGGAARVGFVLGKEKTAGGSRPELYGKYVAAVDVGYASGDANPYDGVEHRFTFDPNHKVGLLLFDEIMRWQTARAATAATDPLLANANRPTPGVELLPSNGGVYGAYYVNPTMVYRPRPSLDLKAGVVIARSTSDIVDPYRLATTGTATNYQGGSAKRHDLGMEIDVGAEGRIPLDYRMTLQLGAQAGILFPGSALAFASGEKMKTPMIVVGRAGLQF